MLLSRRGAKFTGRYGQRTWWAHARAKNLIDPHVAG